MVALELSQQHGFPHTGLRDQQQVLHSIAARLVAGLELAKQGEVTLGQGGDFEPIHVAPA